MIFWHQRIMLKSKYISIVRLYKMHFVFIYIKWRICMMIKSFKKQEPRKIIHFRNNFLLVNIIDYHLISFSCLTKKQISVFV